MSFTFILVFCFCIRIPAVAQNTNSCDSLSNCLNDLSNYIDKCGKELKNFVNSLPKNSTTELCTKAANLFLKFGELQSVRSKDIAECVKIADGTDSSKCPKMNAPSNTRRKRDANDLSKWVSAAAKVKNDCSNGDSIVNDVKSKINISEFFTRQQILDYVKKKCDGKLTLTTDDMPIIGGDVKIENAINKVLNECQNGADVVKNTKTKAEKKQFVTRADMVDYVKSQCQGNSTLIVDDLPNFYDPKLEAAIQKVKNDCSNSKQIITDLSQKFQNKTIFSRQQVVNYVSNKCQGRSTLLMSDVPPFYGETSTAFGKKLEASILKVQRECKNSDDVLYQIKKQHDSGQMKTADEIVRYVKTNCQGQSSLTVDDIPMADCSEATIKNKTQECLNMVKRCSKAKYCNECYELSDLHNAIHKTTLDLSDAQSKCPSSNRKSAAVP